MIAGVHTSLLDVDVEPKDSIATLFEKITSTWIRVKIPHTFVAAYSIIHKSPIGLSGAHPDYIALVDGDPGVVAEYLTPAARIDLTNAKKKTVRDYFGDHVAPMTLSIVCTWPRELLVTERERRVLGRLEASAQLAKWRKEREQTTSWRVPVTTTTASAPPAATVTGPTTQEPTGGIYPASITSAPAAKVAAPRQWQWPWQALASSCLPLASCVGWVTTVRGRLDDEEKKRE